MPTVPDYASRYAEFATFQRSDDGILVIRFHTKGSQWVLRAETRDLFPRLFFELAQDRLTRVIILTGTGDVFCTELDQASLIDELTRVGPDMLDNWRFGGNNAVRQMLGIEAPIILALNGPLLQHAEIWITADIIYACPEALVQDFHMAGGQVPGGDAQVVWEALLGHARAKQFLWGAQQLDAVKLLELGIIAGVSPRSNLLEIAIERARALIGLNRHVLRYTKAALTERLRRQLALEQPYTQALVMLGAHSAIPEVLSKANSGDALSKSTKIQTKTLDVFEESTVIDEGNKSDAEQLVRSFYHAVASGDTSSIHAILADDWEELPPAYPGQPKGPEGYLPIMQGFNAAFPDGRFTVHDILQSGNRFTARTTMQGTHSGSFLGRDASGAAVAFDTIDIHEVVGNKIIRSWHIEDFAQLHAQIDAALTSKRNA